MLRLCVGLLSLVLSVGAADRAAGLRAAAASGDAEEVQALLDQGAPVDAADKNGRTALMLAAQRGRADIVKLLMGKGAHPELRDRLGWTAYGLALLTPTGRGDHRAVLDLLPAPRRFRLAVTADWVPGQLRSSCFAPREELPAIVAKLHLDTLVLDELLAFAGSSGKGMVEIVPNSSGPADALAAITVEPGVTCLNGADQLTLGIQTRLVRTSDRKVLLQKSFGGGFKGLRSAPVDNVAQYAPVLLSWIRPQAGPMYGAIVEMLYRTEF